MRCVTALEAEDGRSRTSTIAYYTADLSDEPVRIVEDDLLTFNLTSAGYVFARCEYQGVFTLPEFISR